MESILPEFMRGLNIVLMGTLILITGGALLVGRRASSTYVRADRRSAAARLPYASDAMRDSIAHAIRTRTIAVTGSMLGVAVASTPLLAAPLGTNAFFMFAVAPAMLAAATVANVTVAVRERLFRPAPSAPRIARLRAMRVADYLDRPRRLLPWVLAGGAVVALAVMSAMWVRTPDRVVPGAAACAVSIAAASVLAFAARPFCERLILDQPQPAADTLELAWDDAFRSSSLRSLRLACALGAWFALSLSIVAMAGAAASAGFLTQLPTWGMLALQFVYPADGRQLPAALYPEWLRPTPAGGVR